ncbi:MAG TPA: hypothetical protein ENG87_03055 [Candidatus Pacearchaeota archaeon]|nr:hypothetical protein BMS3Abin17_00195 [archaeon BMS3Abin17]HDK42331.1 hypothetical protein [Candidatus Pacearchaeota archaeon]HDZ61292.1 hypothetical protein [Candidatus Pacearchaeota archaeon]
MNTKDWLLAGVEVVAWYGFIYYLLYSIKNPVNLYVSALILLALVYIGTLSCPWFRRTEAFKKMLGNKK